jgi:hypothetical protein
MLPLRDDRRRGPACCPVAPVDLNSKSVEPGRGADFGVIDVQPGPARPDRVAGAIASKIIFVMLAVSAQALWFTFIAKLVLRAVF